MKLKLKNIRTFRIFLFLQCQLMQYNNKNSSLILIIEFSGILWCAEISVKACGKEKVNSNYEGWDFSHLLFVHSVDVSSVCRLIKKGGALRLRPCFGFSSTVPVISSCFCLGFLFWSCRAFCHDLCCHEDSVSVSYDRIPNGPLRR